MMILQYLQYTVQQLSDLQRQCYFAGSPPANPQVQGASSLQSEAPLQAPLTDPQEKTRSNSLLKVLVNFIELSNIQTVPPGAYSLDLIFISGRRELCQIAGEPSRTVCLLERPIKLNKSFNGEWLPFFLWVYEWSR